MSRGNERTRPGAMIIEQATRFGGVWTIKKLGILENYLDAYTTALKKTQFRLIYIDAFAGSGQVSIQSEDPDVSTLISGSAERAVRIDNKPFDRIVFVDKSVERCRELESLKRRNPDRDIQIVRSDANTFLQRFRFPGRYWRGVVFLDPFATQVDWGTIEQISQFNALDMWLLFPTSAIARLLPRSSQPDNVDPSWAKCLNRVYGDDSWRTLYEPSRQLPLLGQQEFERDPGVERLLEIYKGNLRGVFGNRFLEQTRPLHNSLGLPIFELLFCVGNAKGITPAKRIAGHILDHI